MAMFLEMLTSADLLKYGSVCFAVSLLCFAMWVYRGFGRGGQLMILAYLTSLVATQASVGWIFKSCPHFDSPCFLTAVQLFFQAIVAHVLVQYKWRRRSTLKLVLQIGFGEWVLAFSPLALCLVISVVAHNASIMYIGLGTSSIFSAFTPVVTTFVCAILGQRFPLGAWMGLAVVCFGAIIAVYGMHLEKADFHKSMGLVLAFLALLARAMKTSLQDLFMSRSFADLKVFTPLGGFKDRDRGRWTVAASSPASTVPKQHRIEPLEVWALQTPLMCFFCGLMSVTLEGFRPLRMFLVVQSESQRDEAMMMICLLFVTSSISCLLGYSSLSVVQMLGAAASQIVGKFNIVITAILALVVFSEPINNAELGGGFALVCGAYIFEREVRLYGKSNDEGLAVEDASTVQDTAA